MSKTIYFVRHGQTVGNVAGQTQGSDDPLNETGLKQAGILAERAKSLDFECIISSDYPRAKVTAERIQEATGKQIDFSELFRELRRPSEFWGCVVRENEEALAAYKLMREHSANEEWHFSDEENFFDVRARGMEALEYLLARDEKRMLIVSHGNFIRNLLGVMLRDEAYAPDDYNEIEVTFSLGNTSITVAEYKYHRRKEMSTWTIVTWNDCAHLGEIK